MRLFGSKSYGQCAARVKSHRHRIRITRWVCVGEPSHLGASARPADFIGLASTCGKATARTIVGNIEKEGVAQGLNVSLNPAVPILNAGVQCTTGYDILNKTRIESKRAAACGSTLGQSAWFAGGSAKAILKLRPKAATTTAIGFTDDAVGTAYQGMRSGGGHSMRHLTDEGSELGKSRLASWPFRRLDLAHPSPSEEDILLEAGQYSLPSVRRETGGKRIVVFLAKEGPFQGKAISAAVPDSSQVAQWGL